MIADHPHVDPGDGRAECYLCGKFVHDVIHSCKGVPVTPAAEHRVRALIDNVRADERERIAQAIETEPWERWSNEGPPSVTDQAAWLHGVGCGARFAARIARSEADTTGGEGRG